MDWREIGLGEVVKIKHGWPFKGELFSEDPAAGPIVVNIGNFEYTGGFRFGATRTRTYTGEYPKEYELAPRSILLVMTCQTEGGEILGIPGMIPEDGKTYLHNQRLGLVVPRLDEVDPDFLYWLFLSPQFNRELCSSASGTKILHTSPSKIEAFRFKLPLKAVQKKIAEPLWSLQKKIDLNRKMNETLEQMARAIFKSWFIDFDPVHAKRQGKKPCGMDDATAALFPDSFEQSGLGEIPAGWALRPLGEITTKIGSGATPRGGSAVYLEQGIALIRSQNVYDSDFQWKGLARISNEAARSLEGVSVLENDILINITGDSILRTCVVESRVLPARVNQHVAIVRPKENIAPRYIHQWLLLPRTKDFLLGLDAGGTRQAVTKGHLESLPVLLPHQGLLDRFKVLTDPLFELVASNTFESRTLADTRDLLLPRLLSGEITIKEAQT